MGPIHANLMAFQMQVMTARWSHSGAPRAINWGSQYAIPR